MLVKFTGPEGAYWVGKELKGANVESAKVGALADLQLATGWTMPEIMEHARLEMVGARILTFLTLRNAGMFVSWAEVGEVGVAEMEFTPEPGDQGYTEAAQDPPQARGGSTPGDDLDKDERPAPSPRKPKSSGSGKRSAAGK